MPPVSEISTPPPLPHTLSSRLRSTIDPTTGCCKHHPSVQLCELVQGGSRWVVRRKICYKCGSRPQAGGGRHKPGVSVTNPGLSSRARDLEKSLEKSGNREGRERRSRSVSVDRLGSSSRGMDRADRKERHRSESNDRHGSSRRRSQSAARRGSSSAALLTGGPLDKAANNPLAASSHRLESAGRGRRSSRELDREKSSSRRASRSKSDDGMESALKELQSQRKEARGRSRSNDALEEAVEGRSRREGAHRESREANKDNGEPKGSSHGRNRGSSSSLHSRALEFTQMALEDVAVTPHQDHHAEPKALADRPHTHHHDVTTPNHHPEANPGAIIQSCPQQLQETPIAENFNESDPIIMIPTLALVPGLPPPPPRTSDEMLRHQERLEMRRRSIRREREERRKRRARERKEEEEGKNKERTKSGGENGRDKAKSRRNFSSNDVVAEAREVPEEPVAPMPSAAALALLDEYDPKETKEEKKHPPTRLDRAKSESHDSEPEPSPAAVALLDANLKRKSERKLANDRRRSSRHQHKKRSHSHDDALTLTSELSFGTAKMYAPPPSNARRGGFSGDHHVRMHPELEGVALPDAPHQSRSAPPMDITVDRSRSLSRSRSARASEDPPSQSRKARDPDSGGRRASETNKRGVSRGASRRASSQALVAREPKQERRESNSRALVQAIDAAEKHEGGRKASVKDSAKARRRSSSRPSRGDDFHKSAPALAASSARSARRGSSKGRTWDATGHEVEAPKNNRAPSRSVERKERSSGTDARSSRHVDARSYSPSRESRAVKSEGGARRNKGGDKAHKHHRGGHNKHHSASSKDGRSRLTSSTHPESHSSEEMARHNSHDEFHASPRPRYEEIEEEEPEPVTIYKKRASSKRLQLQHEDDTTDVGYDKPIGAISFHSGDERSHTSSISSSSTIDDDSTVEHDDEDEEHRRGRARERALHALHGVKGGARKLGTRSRSALGGLKDTRRKWQSALFM